MKRYNLEIGRWGEGIAREYLEKKGYKILEQNYKNKYAEIDLIAREKNNDSLVFVEVKTRMGEQFGLPEDAINRDKMHRLIKNSQAYMAYGPYKNYKSCRIDAICIVLDENKQVIRIDHYQNITS
ncbi:MAG: YraN family protein [bacterium]|nr:YraN family protein [bacterium]